MCLIHPSTWTAARPHPLAAAESHASVNYQSDGRRSVSWITDLGGFGTVLQMRDVRSSSNPVAADEFVVVTTLSVKY